MKDLQKAADVFKVGDYVHYYPNVESAVVCQCMSGATTAYQWFRPSGTVLWRVFRAVNGSIELIPAKPSESLCLGGETGYRYAIRTLNKLCSEYVNPKFAISGRCLGATEDSIGALLEPVTFEAAGEYTYGFMREWARDEYNPYDDLNYVSITAYMRQNGFLWPEDVWLWIASRAVSVGSVRALFSVHGYHKGMVESYPLYDAFKYGGGKGFVQERVICPVVVLRPEVKVSSGEGHEEVPFEIVI